MCGILPESAGKKRVKTIQVYSDIKSNKALKISALFACDPTETRTQNRQLRRLMLYPIELSDPNCASPRNAITSFVWQAKTALLHFTVGRPNTSAELA